MTVTRDELEAYLTRVRARVRDPRAGIYGPGSVSWRIDREAAIMLGGGRAALLQLAHPYVAHAVDQHSQTRNDPVGRFQRTFANVFAMVFGDLEHAIESARRVHEVHSHIRGAIREDVGAFAKGHRYHANHEPALFWVHATLVDSAVKTYELLVAPLSDDQKERYYTESRLFAYLFGVSDAHMPASWRDFQGYMERMLASPELTVGEPARDIGRFLFRAPRAVHRPATAWFRVFTAGIMPPRQREELGFLPWGPREQATFARTVPALKAAYAITPRRLRWFPAYVEARRRMQGKREHDRVGRFLERIALEALRPA